MANTGSARIVEIKQKHLNNLSELYEKQLTLLDQIEERFAVSTDVRERAKLEYDREQLKKEATRIKSEMANAALEVQKWVSRAKTSTGAVDLTQDQPDQKATVWPAVPVIYNNLFDFGEVVVEAGEFEELKIAQMRRIDPVIYNNGLEKTLGGIGRLEIAGDPVGTGVLIGPNRVLTAARLIPDSLLKEEPSRGIGAFLRKLFRRSEPETALNRLGVRFGQDEASTRLYSVVKVLKQAEYAIVELAASVTGNFKPITPTDSSLEPGQLVNILGYPTGQTVKLAGCWVKKIRGDKVLYLGNGGFLAPGAPVFNERWELVALHLDHQPARSQAGPGQLEAGQGLLLASISGSL